MLNNTRQLWILTIIVTIAAVLNLAATLFLVFR